MTRIKLPKTIKVIEEDAFDRVSCLEKVELNEGLETIEDEAFNGCENIQATMIYCETKKEYKDEIIDLVKTLGYK